MTVFFWGLPVLQTAKYTGLHRNTVNRFFKRIRRKLVNHSRKLNHRSKGGIGLDEAYLVGKREEREGEKIQIKK